MDINRRDFFGVIAAPLLRRIGPSPAPLAVSHQTTFSNAAAAACPPLTIASLQSAIAELEKIGVKPLCLTGPLYLYLPVR